MDKCPEVRDVCDKLIWVSQHLHQRMMKSKWKGRRQQWVRDCRNSTCTADFKQRCREFRLHVDWDAVDASVKRSSTPRLDESSRGAKGRQGRGEGKEEGKMADEGEGVEGKEKMSEAGEGLDGAGQGGGTQVGGACSQRPDKGIVEMRQVCF